MTDAPAPHAPRPPLDAAAQLVRDAEDELTNPIGEPTIHEVMRPLIGAVALVLQQLRELAAQTPNDGAPGEETHTDEYVAHKDSDELLQGLDLRDGMVVRPQGRLGYSKGWDQWATISRVTFAPPQPRYDLPAQVSFVATREDGTIAPFSGAVSHWWITRKDPGAPVAATGWALDDDGALVLTTPGGTVRVHPDDVAEITEASLGARDLMPVEITSTPPPEPSAPEVDECRSRWPGAAAGYYDPRCCAAGLGEAADDPEPPTPATRQVTYRRDDDAARAEGRKEGARAALDRVEAEYAEDPATPWPHVISSVRASLDARWTP